MTLSVLMFCPQFRPLVGGAERLAENLALALSAAGCRVRILTPRIEPSTPVHEELGGVTIERFPLTDLSRRHPVHGIALPNIPSIAWQVVRAVLPRLTDTDVLHCHTGSLQSASAALAGHMRQIPVVCTAHMADQRSDLGEIEKTGPSGRFVSWMTRNAISTWVAITEAVAEALARAGVDPARIVRIPNGVTVPPQAQARRLPRGARRFLYLGRLSTNIERDVPTLVAAFTGLAHDCPDVELALVGGGDLYDATKQLVDASAARDCIHMPGFDRPETWLTWADCFVLPSRREGLSVALLEAMAAGLPCIANDIPPNREALAGGEAGVLVPTGDRPALEQAMRDMVTRREVAHRYASGARERVARCYSIGAVADRHIELYNSVVSRVTRQR
jgi:glycosyltransferase involved in cell wall biosynthesis